MTGYHDQDLVGTVECIAQVPSRVESRRELDSGQVLDGLPAGGSLKVTMAQNGERLSLQTVGAAEERKAVGLLAGDRFSAAESRQLEDGRVEVWYWDGLYHAT